MTEPDGTPREALKVAAELAKAYSAGKTAEAGGTATIRIDRDANALGLHGLWESHRAEYLAARTADRAVRLVTAGTDTTTATMPRTRVGGSERRRVHSAMRMRRSRASRRSGTAARRLWPTAAP